MVIIKRKELKKTKVYDTYWKDLIVCCEENFSNTLYRDMMKEWMREKQNIN